jgi:hypothetical protein
MHRIFRTSILALLAGAMAAGCNNDQSSPTSPNSLASFRKAGGIPTFPGSTAFVPEVTNPYLNFERGRIFRYESETDEGLETTIDEVTNLKKEVMGIDVTVVHDQVFLNGELIEDTFDWYAQDQDGNVWYFGEDTKSYHDGQVSTDGSWEAGINGDPGIVMLAEPVRGAKYQQEDAPGIAEDMARIKSLDAAVEVPYGPFDECLQTNEWTPLEPGVREYKFYKAGVGLVLETGKGGERVELVDITD